MLLNNKDENKNVYDFDEINMNIVEIGNSNIQIPKNNHENPEKLSWKTKIIMFLVGFAYVGLFLISLLWALFITSFTDDINVTNIGVHTLTYTTIFLVFLYFCFKSKKYFKKELSDPNKYIMGIKFGVIAIVAEIAISLIMDYFAPSEINGNQSAVNDLLNNYPTLMIINAVIIGPFCEEMTYRVGLYGFIREKNEILGFILSALVFAAMHISFTDTTFIAEITALPVYLAISFVLTYAYKKHGLACSYIAHLFVNLISVLAVFGV